MYLLQSALYHQSLMIKVKGPPYKSAGAAVIRVISTVTNYHCASWFAYLVLAFLRGGSDWSMLCRC